MLDFESSAFNHSATLPSDRKYTTVKIFSASIFTVFCYDNATILYGPIV